MSVTGATLRYQFYNRFDPHSSAFKNAFLKYETDHISDLIKTKQAVASTSGALVKDFTPEAQDGATRDAEAQKLLSATSTQEAIDLFNAYFIIVRAKAMSNSSFGDDLAAFVSAMGADLSLYQEIVNSAKGIPAITAEYTYSDLPDQPITHNARIIAAFQSSNGAMLSLNGAATFYGKLPEGMTVSHFRDFQVAAQGDIPIFPDATKKALNLSVAGYGQYQQSASLVSVAASDLPSGFPTDAPTFIAGTQGWLGVGQVKVTVRGPTGVQIVPLSWKWSNRTDLFAKEDKAFSSV